MERFCLAAHDPSNMSQPHEGTASRRLRDGGLEECKGFDPPNVSPGPARVFFALVDFLTACFVSFSSYVFIEAAALRSIVLRYACAPTATRSYLKTVLSPFSFIMFFCFFGDVAFFKYFCNITAISL